MFKVLCKACHSPTHAYIHTPLGGCCQAQREREVDNNGATAVNHYDCVKLYWTMRMKHYVDDLLQNTMLCYHDIFGVHTFIFFIVRIVVFHRFLVSSYQEPAVPLKPHSVPPSHQIWPLYRCRRHCLPTAPLQCAGLPLQEEKRETTVSLSISTVWTILAYKVATWIPQTLKTP